jgi:phenazine biosynthesis protein phzE
VTTVPWDAGELPEHDLVLLGPGPGDPNDVEGAKVGRLRALAADLLREGRPLVGVCLGHQVLCAELGLPVQRLARPNQGRQAHVTIDGTRRAVGFYNSFAARTADDRVAVPGRSAAEVVRGLDDQVIGLRGPGLATIQFHAESFLTEDGPAILRDVVDHAVTEGGSS